MYARFMTLLFLGCICLSSASAVEPHLMRFADVSDDLIVFTYEDDLWITHIDGGNAVRITRSDGVETDAKFSPDGTKIAFTAGYDGGRDVYVMDALGGEPVRLTYHPASDRVLDWFPDGEHILFRTKREFPYHADLLYKVSIHGGMPEKLPIDRAGLSSLSPDAKYVVYNRNSRELRTWKRHKGGTAQDLWLGSFELGDFKRITTYEGTDNYPMWCGKFIYFTSDRYKGTMNLFKYNPETQEITQLTKYDDYDVKYPSNGPNHIVFQYAESLYLMDLGTNEVTKVPLELDTDSHLVRTSFIDAKDFTGRFNLSPKGKRVVMDVRGEIMSIPVDEGIAYNLTQSSGVREKDPAWSPDGKKIVFISDRTGEEELFLACPKGSAKGTSEPKRLTSGGYAWRERPKWSPDSKYIIFHDKFMRLNLVDAESGEIKVIAQGEYDDGWNNWGIQDYSWSPDSRWVAYAMLEQSLYQSIFLYSMETGESYRVTSPMTQDWSPVFSDDGYYLYFLSNRDFNPIMGFVDQNHIFIDLTRVYILVLNKGDPAPFRPKNDFDEMPDDAKETASGKAPANDEVAMEASAASEAAEGGTSEAGEGAEAESAEGDMAKSDGTKGDREKAEKEVPRSEKVLITLHDFENRLIAAPMSPGNLFRLEAVPGGCLYLKKQGTEFIKYQFVADSSTATNLDLYKFTIEDGETSKLMTGISQYHVSADGKHMIYKAGHRFGVTNVGKANVGDGNLDLRSLRIQVDKMKEFVQIFNEAWRVQRDWFYDAKMHGLNWEKVGDKYRRFLPSCGTRGDVNYLIGEMIAELNAGHTYIYGGDEAAGGMRVSTGQFGADITGSESGYPRIKRIVHGDTWDPQAISPLLEPGCPIEEGDYLLAVDGVKIGKNENFYKYVQGKSGRVVELTYNSEPSWEGAEKYLVKTLRSEYSLRYREWVKHNYDYVDKQSQGRIGYVHIPGMSADGLIEFAKAFYPQHYKEGLIIDVRYNGGGFTSKQIIDRLERKITTMDQPREGKPSPVPERTFRGYLVLLLNRDTGSDGEIFSEAWKLRGFGPAIGQRSWGGAVGIEPHQTLVDGGVTTPPQFGPYELSGKWSIEGRGVEPDIEVVNMPGDVLKGIDAQLFKGIEYLLKKIEEEPIVIPDHPPYPDKSKATLK